VVKSKRCVRVGKAVQVPVGLFKSISFPSQ
jgi:hypothetical protein